MSATMTTVAGILKEVYEGNINSQINDERITIKRIEQTSEGVGADAVGGKYVTFPVRTSRNAGISYRDENVQLAPAGRQGLKSATEQLKYGYGRVRLTGQLIELAETNKQAFTSAMDMEMDGLKDDLLKDENRIAYGHIDAAVASGIKAKVTANSAGTTITVDDTSYIDEGMVIDVTNAGTPVAGGTAVTVVSVLTATTFTVSAAVGGAVIGNYVSRTGDYNKEPNGLNKIVSNTGVLHGLDPATTPKWASYVDSATTTITELAFIKTMDEIRKAGGAIPTAIFASLGVRRGYWNLMTSLRRYNEPKNFAGGLTGLSFMYGEKDLPLVADPDTPAKCAFFLTEPQLKIWKFSNWKWEDRDNSVLKWVTDYDAFEGFMKKYWQLGTHQRNAHGKLNNLTES
jgi:hypothetical protein